MKALSLYGKSWSSPSTATRRERELRRLADWTIDQTGSGARARRVFSLFASTSQAWRTDAVLDSARSAVVRQAHNRLWAQMAVLHALLGGTR
jgi:ornithine carbamoyltransferase